MAATLTASGITCSDGSNFNGTTFNTIGSYTIACSAVNTTYDINATVAGSNLRRQTVYNSPFNSWQTNQTYASIGASGTWRSLAYCSSVTSKSGTFNGPTLWVRIS